LVTKATVAGVQNNLKRNVTLENSIKQTMNTVKKQKKTLSVLIGAFVSMTLSQAGIAQNKVNVKPLDTLVIEKVMGIKGKSNN
jgi:hypothetical protein